MVVPQVVLDTDILSAILKQNSLVLPKARIVSERFLFPLPLRPQRLCGFLIIQMLPDLILEEFSWKECNK